MNQLRMTRMAGWVFTTDRLGPYERCSMSTSHTDGFVRGGQSHMCCAIVVHGFSCKGSRPSKPTIFGGFAEMPEPIEDDPYGRLGGRQKGQRDPQVLDEEEREADEVERDPFYERWLAGIEEQERRWPDR